jgi:predicted ThiF/HesA family dinucleotide-utilizing enzyme
VKGNDLHGGYGRVCEGDGARVSNLVILHIHLPMKIGESVPKRRNIKFRRRGITQKKAYANREEVYPNFIQKFNLYLTKNTISFTCNTPKEHIDNINVIPQDAWYVETR